MANDKQVDSSKRIRIVSDGTMDNTKVYDTNGNLIPFVVGINVVVVPDEPLVKCWLKLANVELDLTSTVDVEEVVDQSAADAVDQPTTADEANDDAVV